MKQFKKYLTFLSDLLLLDNLNILIKKDNEYILNNKKINKLNSNIKNQIKDIKGKAFVDNDKYYLFINLDMHINQEEYLTATHEARHIYQLQIVNENDTELESEKVIEIWENNMKNYLNSNNKNYGYQPLEQDANAFTKYIIKKVFDRDIFVKDINSDFELWYKKMENDFDDEEIKKCLKYSRFNDYNMTKKA